MAWRGMADKLMAGGCVWCGRHRQAFCIFSQVLASHLYVWECVLIQIIYLIHPSIGTF